MDTNNAIKNLLGTAAPGQTGPAQAQSTSMQAPSNPALKNIATNGSLLIQNVSKLSATLSTITKNWGA